MTDIRNLNTKSLLKIYKLDYNNDTKILLEKVVINDIINNINKTTECLNNIHWNINMIQCNKLY